MKKIIRIFVFDALLLDSAGEDTEKADLIDLEGSEVVTGEVLVDPDTTGMLGSDHYHAGSDQEGAVATEEPLTGNQALL